MKFSMNGFRCQLSNDINDLRDHVQRIINSDDVDHEDLANCMNAVICKSNALNCVYSADDPDFTNMGDVEVELIDTESSLDAA